MRHPPNLTRAAVLMAGLCLGSTGGHAHEIWPGVTGFPAMVLHPMAAVDLLLCLLAMGLVAGQQARPSLLLGIVAAAAGIAAGYAISARLLQVYGLWRLPLISAGLAGLLVAMAIPLRSPWTGLVVLGLGVVVGLGVSPHRPGWTGTLEALGGAATAAALVILVVGLPISRLKHPAVGVMTRIAGAWIAAIAMMTLALSFR